MSSRRTHRHLDNAKNGDHIKTRPAHVDEKVPRHTPDYMPALMCTGLTALIVFVYAPVRNFALLAWDDPLYITGNGHVLDGLTWRNVKWAFTAGYASNWHPLTWLSHMTDVQLFGFSPSAYHLTNIIFHIADALLLFLLLRRLTGALYRSAFAAALFAIHPLHVESVAWIAERKDLLSTLFLLLTVWAYADYVRRSTLRRYAMVALFLALGLMAKPMLVTLPVLLLFLDYWPLRRAIKSENTMETSAEPGMSLKQLVVEKLPLLGIAAISSVATVIAQREGGSLGAVSSFPLGLRIANAVTSYLAYIEKTFWPAGLAAFYPYPRSISPFLVAGAIVVLGGVTLFAVRNRSRHPYLLVGWLWYLTSLLPVIGIVQVGSQSMADRYTYVPLIGIFMLIAWIVPDFVEDLPIAKFGLPVAAALVIVSCSVAARAQVEVWRNDIALWQHTLAVTHDNFNAHNNLGVALGGQGKLEDADAHYREALRIAPDFAEAHYNLAGIRFQQGRPADALVEYREALHDRPDYAEAHAWLAVTLNNTGKTDEALTHFREALRLDPSLPEAHNGLGVALLGQRKREEAIAEFSSAVHLKPDYAEAHNNLGFAFAQQDKLGQAAAQFQEALRIKPDYADAKANLAAISPRQSGSGSAPSALAGAADGEYRLATALASQGKAEEAIGHFRKALQIQPDSAEVNNGLGFLLANQKNFDEAMGHYRKAIQARPNYAEAHFNLAISLVNSGRIDDAIHEYLEVERIQPNLAIVHKSLAVLYNAKGEIANATHHAELAAKLEASGK